MAFLVMRAWGKEHVLALSDGPLRVGPGGAADVFVAGVPPFEVVPEGGGWKLKPLTPALQPQPLRAGVEITAGKAVLSFHPGRVLERASGDGGPAAGSDSHDAVRRGAEAVHAVWAERDPDALVDRVVDTALAATGASRGFLLLSGSEGFQVSGARGFDSGSATAEDYQVSHTIARKVFKGGHPIHTAEATSDHRFLAAKSVQSHGIGSVICVPLAIDGKPFGVLYLDRPAGDAPFPSESVALAVPLADAASQAFARSSRYQAAREQLWAGERGLQRLSAELSLRFGAHRFVGQSGAIKALLQLVGRVAPAEAPVLVWGESGTGKELVARMIHAASTRADGPFEAIACSALPDELLEAELFGHVAGAFTGAERDKPGLFSRADGGTVLLDDVTAMSAGMQAKLLRVLQEGTVRPLGSSHAIRLNFRVISTLSGSPEAVLEEGTLRADLYHRLSTLPVRIPPLRERAGDVPLLVEHFRRECPDQPRFHPKTLAVFETYRWPGNVRELKNEVTRAAVLADGVVEPEHLSPRVRGEVTAPPPTATADEVRPMDVVEHEAIANAMRVFHGNRVKVAQALGMARSTLYKRLDKYGIS